MGLIPLHYNLAGVDLPPLVVCSSTLMILYFECFIVHLGINFHNFNNALCLIIYL